MTSVRRGHSMAVTSMKRIENFLRGTSRCSLNSCRGAHATFYSVVARLSRTVALFHYLCCAPTLTFQLRRSLSSIGLYDQCINTFGTLAFSSLPDWAEDLLEGATLVELSREYSRKRCQSATADVPLSRADIAHSTLEDCSDKELDNITKCFELNVTITDVGDQDNDDDDGPEPSTQADSWAGPEGDG